MQATSVAAGAFENVTKATAITVPFVDLNAQYTRIRGEIEARVHQILESTAYVLGPEVAEFENEFAAFLGLKHVIGVANGTDALLLTLRALGIRAGDEVIIPANTFIATAEAIVHAGGRPVLADIDPQTYHIDVEQIERRITPRTKALIPVHLYGLPADLDPVRAIADRHGCDLIEDAAQAHGAAYGGRHVGAVGRAACFSFYPAKNLGAYGDAGAVATNDDALADTVRKLRHHGSVDKRRHDLMGYNSRLDSLQAAVLRVKLKHLDEWNRLRRQHAQYYNELLAGVPGLVTPTAPDGAKHVYHLYVVRADRGHRDELRRYLQERGIETGIHYPAPLHQTEAFAPWHDRGNPLPVAEAVAGQILSLPMYPELGREQIQYVAEHVRGYMTAHACTG